VKVCGSSSSSSEHIRQAVNSVTVKSHLRVIGSVIQFAVKTAEAYIVGFHMWPAVDNYNTSNYYVYTASSTYLLCVRRIAYGVNQPAVNGCEAGATRVTGC
jgi:hypothetical protein